MIGECFLFSVLVLLDDLKELTEPYIECVGYFGKGFDICSFLTTFDFCQVASINSGKAAEYFL